MNRKDTILVAVLINAGVLVVLFTSALKNKQSDTILKEPEAAIVLQPKIEPVSIMKDEIDLAIEQAKKQEAMTQAPQVSKEEIVFNQDLAQAVQNEVVAPVLQTPHFVDVTVKKGDFLAKIAKRYNVSVDEIMKANLLKNSNLKIGQVLKIPQQNSAVIAQSEPKVEPILGVKFYTVKAGDNPWTIAQKHKMKVEELLKLNQLTAEKAKHLKVGDKLKVKG